MKPYTGKQPGITISFHRPISVYINELAACGLLVDSLREITTHKAGKTKAEQAANSENGAAGFESDLNRRAIMTVCYCCGS